MVLTVEQRFEMESFSRLIEMTAPKDLLDIAAQLAKYTRQNRRINEHLAKKRASPLLDTEDHLRLRAFEIEAGKMDPAELRKKVVAFRYEAYTLQKEYGEIFRKAWGEL